ncbi:MAG TPA: hypothetical protein VFH03_17800, partial [Actinoplanes sp.]|nr:hypothetical protein [Actinoplanes sp.]
EAWGALFAQYAGLEPVDKVFRALGRGQIQRITTSRDGDIAVLQLGRGAAAVWAGLAGDHPRRIHLRDPAGDNVGGTAVLSPSGRYVAYANALGGVAVWDLARPDAPIRLARDHLADGAVAQVVTSIAFSADDRRLLVLRQSYARDRAALTAWEIAGARPVRLAPGMAAARPQADAAYFGPDPDQIVLSDWDGVAVYRAGTGRVLRSYPAPRPGGADRIAGHGSLLLSCRDNTLRVLDIVDGRERHSVTVPTCSSSGLVVDSNTGYAVAAESLRPGASNAYLSLVDTGTGRGYRLAAPPVDVTATFDLRSPARTLALARGADGRPLALLADRNGLLYRIRGTTPVALSPAGFAQPATGHGRIASPDGAYTAAILASGRIELFDNRTNRLLTGIDAPPPPSPGFTFAGVWFGFTPDSARLLVVHRDRLVVYAVPGLTAQRSIDLPVPDLGPPPEADGVSDTWASSVLPGLGAAERDDVLILHAGVLTRWNVATGQQTGATVPLRTGTVGERRRAATLAFAPARRPGHPDQVAVVMPGDEIQIFSLSLGRAIATVPWAPRRTSGAVVFSSSGDLFASTGAEGVTTVWRTDDAAAGGRAVPTVAGDVLLGFTPDDNLVTLTTGGAAPEAKLWSADRGKQLMTLTAPADGSGWQLRGDTLTNRAEGLTRTLELDPGRWFERLCALYDTAPCRDDS